MTKSTVKKARKKPGKPKPDDCDSPALAMREPRGHSQKSEMMMFSTRRVVALALAFCALLRTDGKTQTSPKVATPESQISAGPLYRERYRPQFHYTVKKGWINDPCGLVYHAGDYHLFNDHNPLGNVIPGALGDKNRPPSRWSHAVSRDLVHWQEMPVAILPDKLGAVFSGSGVVDVANTAGFGKGPGFGKSADKTLVLVYTSAGCPFSQSISYSNDRGRTWTRYKDNPVVSNQGQMATERDPRVFRHGPTKKWGMVLYVKRGVARFFTSEDLKKWTHASDFTGRDFHECPDMFELPLDGVVRLRILLDRTSLEVFANDGEISMTSCLVPAEQNTSLELYAKGTEVHIESLAVHKLRSAWDANR